MGKSTEGRRLSETVRGRNLSGKLVRSLRELELHVVCSGLGFRFDFVSRFGLPELSLIDFVLRVLLPLIILCTYILELFRVVRQLWRLQLVVSQSLQRLVLVSTAIYESLVDLGCVQRLRSFRTGLAVGAFARQLGNGGRGDVLGLTRGLLVGELGYRNYHSLIILR